MFPFFSHFWCQRRPNKRCSISLTIAHSFESPGSRQFSPRTRSPASVFHHYPETAAQQGCTGAGTNTSFRSPQRWVGHGATGTIQNTFRQERRLELWCNFHGFCTRWSVIDAAPSQVIESIILDFKHLIKYYQGSLVCETQQRLTNPSLNYKMNS